MKRMFKCLVLVAMIVVGTYVGALIADRQSLERNLVRLHVVAQSDNQQDQDIKLQVRDAVLRVLDMTDKENIRQAKAYIQSKLPAIEQVANDTLAQLGSTQRAVVSFVKEKFPIRHYDTFSLPSGIYESLRITIGDGEGQNWWCVVFPKLCVAATSNGMEDIAAGAGFSQELVETIARKNGYQIRFYFLDLIGKMENLFYKK